MRILEILLPPGADRSISPKHIQQIDALQKRMDGYVDKIMDPKTSLQGKEFLKSRLRDDYHELKNTIAHVHKIAEAVHKLPLTEEDFELVKALMSRPIPAVIAPIYVQEIINDDEFNDMLNEFAEMEPGMDVRPHVVEWLKRVMPDQMYRFNDSAQTEKQKLGQTSVIHGYDPHMYHGSNEPITGNAYGRV
jgi:hypothetical protein